MNERLTMFIINLRMLWETAKILLRCNDGECNRWTILFTMLYTLQENVQAMTDAVVAIDLNNRRICE